MTAAPLRGARPRPRDQSLPFQFLRTDRRAWLALVLLFLVSLPAVTTRIYASDEAEYFSYLRSLWFDRDVSFENEYRYFVRARARERRRLPRDVPRAPSRPPACARTSARSAARSSGRRSTRPATSSARALRAAGRPVAGGRLLETLHRRRLLRLGVLRVPGARALGGRGARRAGRRGPAAGRRGPRGGRGLGRPRRSPSTCTSSPPFSHACSAFAVAAFVFAWLRVRRTWSVRRLRRCSARSAALMTMVREQDAFFAFGPAVDFLWTLARDRGSTRSPSRSTRSLGAGWPAARAPSPSPSCRRRSPTSRSTAASGRRRWCRGRCTGGRRTRCRSCSRPEHGLLFWTPLVLRRARSAWPRGPLRPGDRRVVAAAFLVMFAAQVYVSGSVDSWSAAGGFGHRRFVGTTVDPGDRAVRAVARRRLAGRRGRRSPPRSCCARGGTSR